ncbi:MAG: methyltransferase [Phenylobacterium sp.]|uniref:class I SAM-dependent methyltransferase n=1 Tax=Phenylobacterium sp. TaxID=1871053 RepID=UPI00273717BC|nr:methyltransferase [Phenylobacterium sp.]MDP3747859.1 methyltransferase [Phenylobacterium sp.]
MKRSLLLAACAAFVMSAASVEAAPSAAVVAAVADKGRPEADTKRDADRKPAEMLEFAGVKPGQKVADFIPGGGYFTRIFAKTVGSEGKVYAVINQPPPNAPPPAAPPPIRAVAADPTYGNIEVVQAGFTAFALPEPVDVFWTAQNYHDLHLKRFNLDVASVNKQIFNAVKPGGYYVIVDHAAPAGTPVEAADTVHRIDPAIVKAEVEAAGFKFVDESKVLRNDKDDYSKTVFDPSLRGHTDQFIYRFKKPG